MTFLPASTDEEFSKGVEAALTDAMTAEGTRRRDPDWLGHQTADFRDGYVSAQAVMGIVQTPRTPPLRIRLGKASIASG